MSEDDVGRKFGRKLAHHEKRIRDKAMAGLRQWLVGAAEVSEADMQKVMKGIFYCFWMSDKAPVQRKLAKDISGIINLMSDDVDRALLFYCSLLATMRREWPGIDRLRLDKYYTLLRLALRNTLKLLQKLDWRADYVRDFTMALGLTVVKDDNAGNGLRLHFADVYLSELCDVAGNGVSGARA